LRADDGDGVGDHVAARHFIERLQVGKARRPNFQAIRLVGAVGHQVDAEFAFRVLDRGESFARRHVETFSEELEVVDQVFHVGFHAGALGRGDLVVLDHDRPRVVAQPFDALADDAVAFAHFGDTHQVAVVAVTVDADGHVEIDQVVDFVGLHLAQVPGHAGAAQHGAGEAQRLGAFGVDDADAHQALLPDAVVGKQGFVLVDAGGEAVGEVFDEIEQRARARIVHDAQVFLATVFAAFAILRHGVRQVAVDPARPVVGRVHARARDGFVAVHQVFALAEGVQEHGHRAHVERVRAQRHQVVEQARDLVEHDADVLRAQRRLDAQQLLDGHDVRVLVAHHGDVVEAVHVGQRLDVGLVFGQLFGGPVQQADVRVGTLDDFAVELEHQAQHAVRGRVLGAEVQGVVLDFCHDLTPQAVRIFTHGARGDFARVDGDRLVDDAPLFGVVAHLDRARQGEV